MKKEIKEYITLFSLMRKRKFNWFLAIILGLTTLISSIGLLSTSGWFITAAAIAGLLSISLNYVAVSGLIRAFAILRTVARYGGDLVSHNAIFHLLKDLRVRVFYYLSQYRTKLHNAETNSITIMHRLVVDLDRLDLFPLRFILPWLFASIIIISSGLILFNLLPSLFFYIIPGIILAWLIAPLLSFIKGIQLAKSEVVLSEQSKAEFIEAISLLTPLLIWKTWNRKQAHLNQLNYQRTKLQCSEQFISSLIALIQNLGLGLALIGCLYKGIELVEADLMTVPWLLAILLGVFGLQEALAPLAGSFISLGLSLFSKQRVNALIQQNEEFTSTGSIIPKHIEKLELKDICARIPNALNGPSNVSFVLQRGDLLIIRGPSGIGKTTLLDLIAGEISQLSGTILLNNKPLSEWNLQETLGYLPQDIDIFDLNLRDNLTIGQPNATDEELWEVLNQVHLAEWAKSRAGLKTSLGELGTEISGGQARRIALARLLLANRKLLLLDEPFAGLDYNNIVSLYRHLQVIAEDKIILIVSHHDLATLGVKEYWLKG